MSGILRLESLTKGNTLKQGDKTPLKYRLFDADGEKLNIAGKSAKVRLVYPDFLTIGYEKGGLTVGQDDTVTFTIDNVIPSRVYHVEIIVDEKFIFPSHADESKFTVDKSSFGTESNIIEIVGVDAVVRKAVDLINQDPSLIIDEDKLVGDIISNTGIGNINEYYKAFNDLKPKAEQSITKSSEALTKSQNALNVANGIDSKATNALSLSKSADTLSKSVQEQFNQVVIDGDSSVEAAQARVDTKGQTNPTLKARLDKEHSEVTTQLAQTKNSLMFSGDFGESIDIPLDFPLEKIPFNLFADTNDEITHDYDITNEFFGTNIYVLYSGNDANDGLSELTPVKTLKRAIELANEVSTSRAIINIVAHPTYKSVLFNVNYGLTANIPILRDIVIKPLNHETEKVYITSADVKAFSVYNSIYKTTGTSTFTLDVFDTLKLEVDGSPKVYKKKNSISEVEVEKGSWFMDSSGYIYVNTIDGRPADYDIVINRDFGSFALVFGGKKIVMYNTTIARSGNVNAKDSLFLSGDSNSTFINQYCHFMFGFNNGLSVKNADSFSFDSTAHDTGMDGFNYHSEMIENPYMIAFEYKCKGNNFGTRKTGTNNASTAHEGIYTLRIDCEYHTAHGPVIADVNGCYSVIYKSKAYDSIREAGETKSAFYFDNALQVANHGKAYLIECEGGGEDTFSVNSDKTIPIYLRKMKGRNVPNGNLINPY